MPDLKTPLLWILSIALIGALGTAAIERTQAANAKQKLAAEKLDREREKNDRNRAAIRHAEAQIAKLASHSTTQTEIADALKQKTDRLALADARNADLAARMRSTAGQLAAALGREQRRADAAAAGDPIDRPDPFAGLLVEAGGLLAEARTLAAESAGIVGRRDGEVRALSDVIANDRALCRPDADVLRPSLAPSPKALAGWPLQRVEAQYDPR